MFNFKTEEVKEKFVALLDATDGTEPCYDPDSAYESKTDLYVENWTNRGVSKEVAEALCADCPVYDLCRDYAMSAQEPYGIWGGTRPTDRGIPPKYKAGRFG